MKKYLLIASIFTVLVSNTAKAERYYEEDGYYYQEQPRYVRRVEYVEDKEQPRYQRIKKSEAKEVKEPRFRQRTYQEYEQPNKIRPYIGLDLATTSAKFGSNINNMWTKNYDNELPIKEKDLLDDKHSSINFVVGTRFNKHFGAEAFYEVSNKNDSKSSYTDMPDMYVDNYQASIEYHAIGIDFQGYIPINQEFELLASLGLGQYYFETKGSLYENQFGWSDYEYNLFDGDSETLGIRLGIGAQYNVTDHVSLRAMARYVKMNDDDYIKSLTELSLGIRYMC